MNEKKTLWWWVATWFGSGLSPIVSGTVGSLAALPFAYVIHMHFGGIGLWCAAFIIFFVGVWASNQYMQNVQGKHDPGEIVVDEVAGQWLLLSVMPMTWQGYLLGFILFRAFDIVKPWPVSWADKKVDGGIGVMLDDMMAAMYPIALYLLVIIAAQYLEMTESIKPLMLFMGGINVF
ncbi:MAG: phosphatidylglycerophosphatase A [Rickettsiales bacterium]